MLIPKSFFPFFFKFFSSYASNFVKKKKRLRERNTIRTTCASRFQSVSTSRHVEHRRDRGAVYVGHSPALHTICTRFAASSFHSEQTSHAFRLAGDDQRPSSAEIVPNGLRCAGSRVRPFSGLFFFILFIFSIIIVSTFDPARI